MSSGGASIPQDKLGGAFDFSDPNCTNNLSGAAVNDLSRSGNSFGFNVVLGSPYYTSESNKRGAVYFAGEGFGFMGFGPTYYPSDSLLSFCTWIKVTPGTGNNQAVAGKWGSSKNYLLTATTNSVSFYVNSSLTASVSHNIDTVNSWRHVGITYNTSLIKLFVDGNLVRSSSFTSSITVGGGGQNMALGFAGADFFAYVGYMGNFYFYSRSLADNEMIDIYDNQKNRFI